MKIFGSMMGGVVVASSLASQTVTMSDTTRIEATISSEAMNRIAVANDRITQIFGDEGTFESQHDESTGQIFLKPTPENGKKNLSVTVITEQGITQDLTLKPTERSAATLILKPEKPKAEESFVPAKGVAYQEQILGILKQAVSGQLPITEGASVSREAPEGYHLEHQKSLDAASYRVHIFDVENKTDTSIEIQEKAFYQKGDLAISAGMSVLPKGAKTQLYVVTRS